MPNLFRTLVRRRGSEASRSTYDLSWYIQNAWANNPFGLTTGIGYTRDNKTTEQIQHNFTGYVNGVYKANGVVFAIILARLLLFSEARFQWRQVRPGGVGELWGDDGLNLLRRPWPNGTTGELLARMEQDVSLGGNFYCVNEGDRLRRLRPDWMSIILSARPEEATEVDVAGYMFTPGGVNSGAEPTIYLPDQIAHWSPIPDPDAQYRGMSWISPVVREVQADNAATDHKDAFFRNAAKPGLVVSLKDSVTAEQFERFMNKMNEAHQGTENAYRTMYVGGGADVTVAGANLQQMDFKAVQGAGETRLCAAGGVPPIIVGLSEGLQSATYSNYGMARRKFGDHWARPQWRSACAALEPILDVPPVSELWYDDRGIAFLREDQQDAANIQQVKASTIGAYITAGFTPESAVSAVDADDRTLLVHTGLVSVQLQPPGAGVPTDPGQPAGETGDDTTSGTAPDDATAVDGTADEAPAPTVGRAKVQDSEQLHHYWTRGPGLAKWAESPTPWTTLHEHLVKYLPDEEAKRAAADWFHEIFGFWPGADANRVLHGHPPRGKKVGPG